MYAPVPQFHPGPTLAAPKGYAQHTVEDEKMQNTKKVNHAESFKEWLNNPNDLFTHWLYFILKVLALAATVFMLIVLIMISTTTVLGDNPDSAVYLTNTFYTSNYNEQNISWQVLTSPTWTNLPRAAVTSAVGTVYNNVQFEHFYECMWVAQEGWGLCNGSAATVATYKTCLDTAYSTQLAACAPHATVYWPTSHQYTQCINAGLGGNAFWNLNAFRTCVDQELWPLYEIPQDVSSTIFLGTYSWPLLVMTSTFLFFVFALYTVWPVDYEDATIIEHGKPQSSFARLGMAWSGFAAIAAAVWFLLVCLIAFRASSNWPNNNVNLYPSSHQTNVVMVTATLAVIFYFIFDAAEFWDRSLKSLPYDKMKGRAEHMDKNGQIPMPFTMEVNGLGKPGALGYFFPQKESKYTVDSIRKAGDSYAPTLLQTWSDAYLLDSIFVVGVVGGTLQVYTADIYNIFWCIAFYRITHLGVARAVHFAYVHIKVMENTNQTMVNGVAATKMLALAMHFAGVFALIVPLYIVFDSTRMLSEYDILKNTFILSYLIPEALRLVGHLLIVFLSEYPDTHFGLYILVLAQFIWTWDLFVRTILLWILLWGNAGSRGTKPYLLSALQDMQKIIHLP